MKKKKYLLIIPLLLFIGLYYYIALPAINIHSPGLWKGLLFILLAALFFYIRPYMTLETNMRSRIPVKVSLPWNRTPFKILAGVFGLVLIIYLGGNLLSSPVFRAGD